MKYQITYDDALRICEAYKNFNFYKSEYIMYGYRVVTFNYFLCQYDFFINPLKGEPEIHAKDMRGVTFVFNKDGSLYKRFLMLEKFFNVNQVDETQIHLLRDKKIKRVTTKEDGSLIAFMNLPNGEVFAKTQAGFTNEQSLRAKELYNTQKDIKKFVDDILNVDFTPLFEYVAFDNRIVLKYSGRELRLIGVRDNKSGEYFSGEHFLYLLCVRKGQQVYDIPYASTVNIKTINELEELCKTSTDIEGFVVEFDGQLVKWKTEWYFNLHGIRTMHIFREDYIIENYLKETLDDVTQELNVIDDIDAFKFINKVTESVNNWSDYIEDKVNELVDLYDNKYNKDWNKFATENHRSCGFGLSKIKIDNLQNYRDEKIEYMLKSTRTLMKAKRIIEKYENINNE